MRKIFATIMMCMICTIPVYTMQNVSAEMLPTIENPYSYYEKLDFTQIELGYNHTMAITSTGRIFTWGSNSYGQLGNGTYEDKRVPTEITSEFTLNTGEIITGISAGDGYSLAITSDHRVFTWGNNSTGQLGTGNTANQNLPTDITGQFPLNVDEVIQYVVVGKWHSLAVTSMGRVFVWGYNFGGQLGDGTTEGKDSPVDITTQFGFQEGETISNVSLSYSHSIAVTTSGRIFAWGKNDRGQLGDGTTVDKYTPTDITSGFALDPGDTIISASLGMFHSAAISEEGRVFTWGYNHFGQLGDGSTTNSSTPIDITSSIALTSGETIRGVSFGGYHSSILTSNHRIFVWGRNNVGQLGNDSIYDLYDPVDITSLIGVHDSEIITTIDMGNNQSSVITSEERIFMWGSNDFGQIGDETTELRKIPVDITNNINGITVSPIGLPIGTSITSISMGARHAGVLTSQGQAYLWGLNSAGQLGVGVVPTNTVLIPVNITEQFPLHEGETIVHLSLNSHSSFALTSEGRFFSWGAGDIGQLGSGTNDNAYFPTEITDLFQFTERETISSITTYGGQAAIITSTNRVFTWGWNYSGQLGDGTTDNIYTPIDITDNLQLNEGETVLAISLGGYHTSVITSDHRVLMLGSNAYGQLGNDSTTSSLVPIDITSNFNLLPSETVTKITLGTAHSMAITSLHRVFTWGRDWYGELGNGTQGDTLVPTEITNNFSLDPSETVVDIYTDSEFNAVLTSNGRVFTWGYNEWGQLGNGTRTSETTPGEITSFFSLHEGEQVVDLSLGAFNSSAITSSGRIFIWGLNDSGQAGDGVGELVLYPKLISRDVSEITNILLIYTESENNYLKKDITISIFPEYDCSNDIKLIEINHTQFDSNSFTVDHGRIDVLIPNSGEIGDVINYEINSITLLNDEVFIPIGETSSSTTLVGDTVAPTIQFDNEFELYVEQGIGDDSLIQASAVDDTGDPSDIIISGTVDWASPGQYNITYSSTDSTGNSATRTRTVHVIPYISTNVMNYNDMTLYYFDDETYSDTTDVTHQFVVYNNQTYVPEEDYSNYAFNDLNNELIYNIYIDNRLLVVSKDVSYSDHEAPTFDTISEQTIEAGIPDIDWTTLITNEFDNSDGALTKVEVEDNVDYDTPGVYTVTVEVVDESLNETTQTFNVEVVDTTPPTFDNIPDQTIEAGISDINWTTLITNDTDNSNGALTKVEVEDNVVYDIPGIYPVTLKVEDVSLNETTQTFNVEVVDTTPPFVSLNTTLTTISVDDPFEDGGVTYTDISEVTITIDGMVDTTKVGAYTLLYTIQDEYGNTTIVQRIVHVVEANPMIEFKLDKALTTIYVGTDYIDGSCSVFVNGEPQSCTVLENNVDVTASGVYTITYSYSHNNKEYTYNRYVFVVDDSSGVSLYYDLPRKEGEWA